MVFEGIAPALHECREKFAVFFGVSDIALALIPYYASHLEWHQRFEHAVVIGGEGLVAECNIHLRAAVIFAGLVVVLVEHVVEVFASGQIFPKTSDIYGVVGIVFLTFGIYLHKVGATVDTAAVAIVEHTYSNEHFARTDETRLNGVFAFLVPNARLHRFAHLFAVDESRVHIVDGAEGEDEFFALPIGGDVYLAAKPYHAVVVADIFGIVIITGKAHLLPLAVVEREFCALLVVEFHCRKIILPLAAGLHYGMLFNPVVKVDLQRETCHIFGDFVLELWQCF